MIRIPKTTLTVGSSEKERKKVAEQYDFHPTLLDDELAARKVTVDEFLVDEYPVTNAEYAAFLEATGHPKPWHWGRWATAERADHPVVEVTADSAKVYAEWLGKRLPTPEEWEAALEGARGRPKKLLPLYEWLPQTDARDADPNTPSRHGVIGFGQVSEWTSQTRIEGGRFRFSLLKGPSWMTEEDWGFRVPAAFWGHSPWASVYTGFRCAADAGAKVKEAPKSTSFLKKSPPPSPKKSDEFSAGAFLDGGAGRFIALAFNSPQGFAALYAPEMFSIDGRGLIDCDSTIEHQWFAGESKRCRHAHYAVRAGGEEMQLVFDAHDDYCDMEYRFGNPANTKRRFYASTCVNLYETPNFFDMEGMRTYIWFGWGDWIPVRRLSRGGPGSKRWITSPSRPEIPADAPAALYAVVSRDGKSVFGYGRADLGASYGIANNFCFTCFHIDPTVEVAAGQTGTLKARIYSIWGGLEDLKARFAADFGLKG